MPSERPTIELLEAAEDALVEAAFCTGAFHDARELAEAARDQAVRDGDEALEAAASDRLGMVQHYANITRLMDGLELQPVDVDAEEQLFRHALAIRERRDDVAGMAQSMLGLGLVFQVLRQDWTTAMPLFWRALEIARVPENQPDLYTYSEIHRHVGFYFLVEDVRLDEAVWHLERSLELREQLGDPRPLPSGLVALGEAELERGDPRAAVKLLDRAVEVARQAGLMAARVEEAERVQQEAKAALAAQPRDA